MGNIKRESLENVMFVSDDVLLCDWLASLALIYVIQSALRGVDNYKKPT